MELLAPAGNAENFFTALEAGADAVYVGAPGFNARNLARDLRLDEIAAMIHHCRSNHKKIYIAANSLLLEKELPLVIETLGILEELKPDALIVQDLGMINLLRYYFPRLKYHASTLLGVHNILGVDYYTRLGCDRVVLARELTLDEISRIASQSKVELEVFIHGAMCFSFSGHCLFSSYLGGKSGLRGRCVQPCRRSYAINKTGKFAGGGRRGSYLFSMNDLDGLKAVRELRDAGVASLKIEGRLRSANYVEKVVQAYRLVLDADPEKYDEVITQAELLLSEAMSRKVSSGYFFTPMPTEAISPEHSGNLGLHLGRSKRKGRGVQLTLKEPLFVGDRLRYHLEPSGERIAVTLRALSVGGHEQENAKAAETVLLPLPESLADSFEFADVYKVDTVKEAGKGVEQLETSHFQKQIANLKKKFRKEQTDIHKKVWETAKEAMVDKGPVKRGRKHPVGKGGVGKRRSVKLPVEWWLRIDSVRTLQGQFPLNPDRYLIELTRQNVHQAGQLKKMLGKRMRNVTWALPPVISDANLIKYSKQIKTLLRAGFRSFQLGQLNQVGLFAGERVFLSGDYSLNLINNQALLTAAESGLEAAQLAIESDRSSLQQAIQGYKQLNVPATRRGGGRRSMRLGLTVYGAPPLFTSRIDASFFQYEKPVISPKQEKFVISKGDGVTRTRPLKPFSLLPYLDEINRMGVDYVVVDLTGRKTGKRELQDISDRLEGVSRVQKLPTFNYLGTLE